MFGPNFLCLPAGNATVPAVCLSWRGAVKRTYSDALLDANGPSTSTILHRCTLQSRCVASWCYGWGVGSRHKRSRVRPPAVPLSGNNLGQVVHTHVPPAPHSNFGTGQGAVMPCGSEGNRRSGVALAMRHRLKWIIRAPTGSQPSQGDEHPTYALLVEYGPFIYLPTYVAITGLQDFVSPNLAVENWPGLYSYHVQENGARSSRLTGLVERKFTPTRLIFAACLKSDVEFAILRTYYTPFPKKI